MLLAAGVISIGVLLSPPPPEAVRRAVDAVYADPSIQRTLPGAVPLESGKGREGRRPSAPDRRRDPSPAGGSSTGGRGFATFLLWTVGLIGAGVLVAVIAQAIRERRGARGPATAGPAAAARAGGERPGPAPIDDADRLAAEGRYAEAVHALLLHVVRGLTVDGRPDPPPFTSRAPLARAALAPPRRAAFGALVEAVEHSLFGGRPVDATAFAAARDAAHRAAAPGPGAA